METVSLKQHMKMFWSFISILAFTVLVLGIITITFITTYNNMTAKIAERDSLIAKYYFGYDYQPSNNNNTNINVNGGEQ